MADSAAALAPTCRPRGQVTVTSDGWRNAKEKMSIGFLAPTSNDPEPPSPCTGSEGSYSPVDAGFPTTHSTATYQRRPRAPRPSYSEEQKFFIMHSRIMKELSWPDIENNFAATFGQRTKGGLTSAYYRIRREWGLEEVLKSESSSMDEHQAVEVRAGRLSQAFLREIGFFQ